MSSFDWSKAGLAKDDKMKLESLLWEYRELFVTSETGISGLGRTNVTKHVIKTSGASPIKQQPHRVPHAVREEVERQVEQMLDAGVIRPSSSPWSCPLVLVKKLDGSLRFCVDYRKLNSITVKDAYPLPRIDDTLDALGDSTYFSTLDMSSGYWQVEVAEKDKAKTAFTTGKGHFEFNVMPFGLSNAQATFQRLMDLVLSGLHYGECLFYPDDVIVLSSSFDNHLKNPKSVFTRLVDAGLKWKSTKCHLCCDEVHYLGYIVSRNGLRLDPEKYNV